MHQIMHWQFGPLSIYWTLSIHFCHLLPQLGYHHWILVNEVRKNLQSFLYIYVIMWLFPHHLCGSLLLLRCLHRGVWVLTAINWISLKPLPPTTITGNLLEGALMICVPPQKGPSVTGWDSGGSKGTLLAAYFCSTS